MKVMVVGATGTVGPHVVRRLVSGGHEVVGVTTSEGKRASLEALGATAELGDALDATGIAAVVDRVRPDVLVNVATRIPAGGPRRPAHMAPTSRLRREGTRNLLDAARRAGVRRYVSESMMFIYGFGRHEGPVDESQPRGRGEAPGFQDTVDAIAESEAQIAAAVEGGEMEGVSLRFGLFHGADASSTLEMAAMVRKRRLPLIGGGHALLSWIALEDAAAAIALAVEAESPKRVYNVVDDEPIVFADYIGAMAEQLGAKPPRSMPAWMARPFASYAAAFMDDVRLPVSNALIKQDLGWQPEFPSYREVFARLEP